MHEERMPIWEHVSELRKCLLRSVAAILVGFVVAYIFAKPIFNILRGPYDAAFFKVLNQEPRLVQTTLLEGFLTYLKVGFLGGFVLAFPVILYQVWVFIAPALKPSERKHVLPFVTIGTCLFATGAFFGYFLVFPVSFEFFLTLTMGENIDPMIRMQEYLRLANWMLLGFGLSFEAPLVVLYLVHFGVLSPASLTKSWRGVIVGICIFSALITPTPDIATLTLMSVPLMGLYGLTILIAKLMRPR